MIADSPGPTLRRADAAQRLSRLLDVAADGTPSVAVLRGGALVGKTHLAAATAEEARRRSFRVAEVDAKLSSLSFYAVARLTRQLGVRNDAPADDLARLHGLRLACQRGGAGRAGVAMIVDNAEWLAPGDAEALHDLIVSPPLGGFFCLLTIGDGSSTRRTTSDLVGIVGLKRARPEWISVGPLTDEEVALIAQEHLGAGLMTYRFVRDVCALSNGVAGHAVQILEAVNALPPQDRGRVMTGSEFIETAIVPGPLVDDLIAPLQQIGDDALAVGRALGVLRGPATVTEIATVAALPEATVERALCALEDRNVLTTIPAPADDAHSWFNIPLIAVALRRSTPLLQYRTLNRRAAEMREGENIDHLHLDPDRLQRLVACYFASSLPLVPERMDRTVDHAQQLVVHSRYAAARRLLEGSIARAGVDPAITLPPRAFTVLSEALSRSGENVEASRALDAASNAEQSGGSAADTLIRQARTAVALGRTSTATDVLSLALEREDLDRSTRVRLMIELARLMILNRDPERGRTLCTEAYELACSLRDRQTTTEADLSLHVSYVYAGQAQRALAHCRRALISSAHPEVRGRFRARAIAGTGQAILDAGCIRRGLHWLRRAHREAEIAEDLATASWTSQLLAEGCIEHGDWDEAARWTARAVRLDSSLHRDRSLQRSRSLDARLRALRGVLDPVWALDATEPQQADSTDAPPTTAAICIARVEHAMLAGRPRHAHAVVTETLAQFRGPIARSRALIVELLPAAVTTACAMGDAAAAAAAVEELAVLAEQVGDELLIARPLVRFARAQVAALEGDWQVAAFESARAGSEMIRVGYMWRAANAFALAGEANVRLKQPRAEEYLTRAFRTFRAVGAQPRVAAVRDLLHEIGSRAPRTATPTSVLTARQWQIARSAADGKTDAAIAAGLSISRRTVTTHMHHILGRLDLTSRHQLTDWFREHPEPQH